MKPFVSIIIPTYNCRPFLEEGLVSVLEQLPEDYELIVVDDGSSDGTLSVLARYEGRYGNLQVCPREHRGASGARNAGLDRARGDYIAFMDCDDCLREGFLPESRPLLGRGADLYIFGIERVYLDGNSEFWTLTDRDFSTISEFADEYIRTRRMLIYSNCNKFYKRDLIEEGKLRFEENLAFGEDRIFNYRYLMNCRRVMTSELLMLRYLQRSMDSMSARPVSNQREHILRLHEEKVNCFLSLSKGTTEEERLHFIKADWEKEMSALT